MAKIEITQPAGSGGTVNTGVLQIEGGGPITNSSQRITDQSGNTSPLYISSTALTITTPTSASAITRVVIQGSTDSAGYILRAVNRTGTEIFNIKDDGSVLSTGPLTVSTKLAVGPSLSTPSDQSISLTTVSSTDNLRNFIGKNISNTAGLQPFKVNAGRSRGTSTTPTAVQTNDGLASFNGFGHNGTDWTATRGGMYIYAAENWGLLANGTYITWRGAAVGGTTVTEWAKLESTGLTISTIANATTDTDKFLVSDGGVIKYRTGNELLSDLGFTGAPVYGGGTATRLAFWSGTVGASSSTLTSSSALNWDNENGRLGVGSSTPSARLQITGDGVANTVRFESSASTNLFTLSDQGLITAFAPATTALTGTTEIIKSTSSFIAPSAGSGSFQPLSIAYTINNTGAQTGTATGIFLNATEAALGGMTHNLIDLKVGNASKFTVNNSGSVNMANGQFLSGGGSNNCSIRFSTADIRISLTASSVFTIYNPGVNFTPFNFVSANSTTENGSLAINKNAAAATSSILELVSTTRGFLPPRMTTTQKNAITAPATGLVVYDTTLNKLAVYTSAAWEAVTSA